MFGAVMAEKRDEMQMASPTLFVEGLLGVVTLEILGLVFNPFRRTLQLMRMILASFRAGDEWEGRRIWTSF